MKRFLFWAGVVFVGVIGALWVWDGVRSRRQSEMQHQNALKFESRPLIGFTAEMQRAA